MRGVLVDQDQAALGLRHDVVVVQLGARGAERIALERHGVVDRAIFAAGGGRPHLEALRRERRLIGDRGFGEAARQVPRGRRITRPERPERGRAERARWPTAGGGETLPDRADQEAAHQCGRTEAHLRLGRMDVDVDLLGRELQEQGGHRLAVARQQIAVSGAQRTLEQAVLHRPAVDEQMLEACRVVAGIGQADQTRRRTPSRSTSSAGASSANAWPMSWPQARASPLDQIGPRRLEREHAPALDVQAEGDARIGHGQALERLARRLMLGAVRLQELEAGRGGEEQVAHLDPGAEGARRRRRRRRDTGLDVERKGVLLAARPADDAQPADAGERGQRLAAKAEQGDPDQLVVVELGGGVALHRERELVRRDAAAIVGDRDQRPPAAAQLDRDPRRTGIDRVLDQLLDRGRRPLDHLTGGDPVDHAWRQGADGWHWCSGARRRLATGSMPGRRSSGKMPPAPTGQFAPGVRP